MTIKGLSLLISLFAFTQVSAGSDKCYALVLGGGGPRGAYEAGALLALTEFVPIDQLKYEIISGISIGAMNACFCVGYDQGEEREMALNLAKIWRNIKGSSEFYTYWFGFLTFRGGIFNTYKLYKFIMENTGDTIRRNIAAAATDYNTGGYVDFNISVGIDILQKACYASGAYPPFFPPVDVLDEWYGDGAMVANANPFEAVEECKNKGYNYSDIVIDVIYAVPINGLEDQKTSRTRDTIERIDQIYQYFTNNWYLEVAKRFYKKTDLRYFIIPKVDFGAVNTTPEQINLMINTGYNDTKEMINMTVEQREKYINELLNYSN